VANEREVRPWGDYEVVTDGGSYRVKRITVTPGERLSYQRHRSRSEHWYVVEGRGVATVDEADVAVEVGTALDIPAGTAHRISNDGDADLTFVEVQTGDYFGEDDIERLSDDYGR
jgi:mannose-6-phosphate isomerase